MPSKKDQRALVLEIKLGAGTTRNFQSSTLLGEFSRSLLQVV
jgi:hypothetical protein